MISMDLEGLDGAIALFERVAELERVLVDAFKDAIDDELAGLFAEVIGNIDAANAIGATKLYRKSITLEAADRTEKGVEGGVFAGASDAEQLIQAFVMETGAKPHAKRKHPYFWIVKLADYVKRKEGLSAPRMTDKKGRKLTLEQARKAMAVGIGRAVETKGIQPRRIFGKAWDAKAEGMADRIAERVTEAMDLHLAGAAA